MTLARHEFGLSRRLSKLEDDFLDFFSDPKLSTHERWYKLEGLISQTWQSWCHFCRSVVIDSCRGSITAGGQVIARANPAWSDAGRVAYEARCIVLNQLPRPGTRLSSIRAERITWGDVDKLVDVVAGLRPANHAQLLSGFGGGLPGPKHLQVVRNASAHISQENASEVKRLAASYYGPSLRHPIDLSTWLTLTSRNPAYIAWTADIRSMASVCVN